MTNDRMIEEQIASRGVTDWRVLAAMRSVDRALFVPSWESAYAYSDRALSLGMDQTISQPYIVGYMTQLLAVMPHHTVLEIGTGSGYQTAILSRLARIVWSIELLEPLARTAQERLTELGCTNVRTLVGDGMEGLPEQAPFDRIILTAAPPELPPAIPRQLAIGGRLVAPVGRLDQRLVVMDRLAEDEFHTHDDIGVRFVPLVHGHA